MAALLHYFFLAGFCWMLCEGIMLYLMLVVVFSRLSRKWWFFFILGWGKYTISSQLWTLDTIYNILHMPYIHVSTMHTCTLYFLATPLLPVVIGLAAGHNGYGVTNEQGDLQL